MIAVAARSGFARDKTTFRHDIADGKRDRAEGGESDGGELEHSRRERRGLSAGRGLGSCGLQGLPFVQGTQKGKQGTAYEIL